MTPWTVRVAFALLLLALLPLPATRAASSLQLVGAGLIEHPIAGRGGNTGGVVKIGSIRLER